MEKKTYDALAYRVAFTDELVSCLRQMLPEERDAAITRFGPLKQYMTFIKSGSQIGGWPEPLVRFLPIYNMKVVIRSYRNALEMTPNLFEWEPIEPFGQTPIEDVGLVWNVYGGTLKNAAHRL